VAPNADEPAVTRYDVRPIEAGDADALGVAHIAIWRETYADLMPADFLASLSADRSAQRFRASVDEPDPGTVQLVGTADGVPVGFAMAGPTRDDPPDPPHELYVVNVLAEHHGTGLGERLLTGALTPTAGAGPVSLWVVRGNARARSFYARLGFTPDGRTKPHPGTGVIEERWVRRGVQSR
jgi:GNAT superfamily N-acetyltransferase